MNFLIFDYDNVNFNVFKSLMINMIKPTLCYKIDLLIPTENSLSRSLIESKTFYFKLDKSDDVEERLKSLYDVIYNHLADQELHPCQFEEIPGSSVNKGFILDVQTSPLYSGLSYLNMLKKQD